MKLLRIPFAVGSLLLGLLVILPVAALALPFWLVSGLTRAFRLLLSVLERRTSAWQELIEFEPVLGWKNRGHIDTRARNEGVYRLTTDADGWRGSVTLADSDIVVFGDSFAFGYAADDMIFFAHQVEGARVKAIGANGYNLVQELLWMERLAPKLRGKLVVWFIYYGNDLYENLQPKLHDRYRMPFVRNTNGLTSWEIVTEHVSPESWSFPVSRPTSMLAEICSPTFTAQRAFAACEFLIQRGRETCEGAGARLVVLGIPDRRQLSQNGRRQLAVRAPDPRAFDADKADRELAKICRRLGVPFVPLKRHLTVDDYLRDDEHWNARGHRCVARLLTNLLQQYPETILQEAVR